jgi:hypothetical protein
MRRLRNMILRGGLVLIILSALLVAACSDNASDDIHINRTYIKYDPDSTSIANIDSAAAFRVPIADGVHWVPANALGASDMTNQEIEGLDGASPEQIAASIDTLHELIQYYKVHAFTWTDDNILIRQDGIIWEHHKPGQISAMLNHGCCAASANLCAYVLAGDYDEIGFISMQHFGSGHIINYLRKGSVYYLIDFTHYANNVPAQCPETGRRDDFDWNPIATILETDSLEKWTDYYRKLTNYKLMYQVQTMEVPPLGYILTSKQFVLYYPSVSRERLKLLYDDTTDPITVEFPESDIPYPEQWGVYDWLEIAPAL